MYMDGKRKKKLKKWHRKKRRPSVKPPPCQGEEPLIDIFFGGAPFVRSNNEESLEVFTGDDPLLENMPSRDNF